MPSNLDVKHKELKMPVNPQISMTLDSLKKFKKFQANEILMPPDKKYKAAERDIQEVGKEKRNENSPGKQSHQSYSGFMMNGLGK